MEEAAQPSPGPEADASTAVAATASGGGVKRLPQRDLVCVELPFRIRSTAKALATIGGEKAVGEATNDESKKLQLRFRPSDPNSRPIVGERVRSKKHTLLLRVRRKVLGKLFG